MKQLQPEYVIRTPLPVSFGDQSLSMGMTLGGMFEVHQQVIKFEIS